MKTNFPPGTPTNKVFDEIAMLDQESARKLCLLCFEHLQEWPLRSAAAFRNAVLGPTGSLMVNPLLNKMDTASIKFCREALKETVSEGRMIDFGFVPNEIIKAESIRARIAFEENELIHPYEHWLGVMPWEGGFNAYLVIGNQSITHKPDFTVIELYGVSVPDIGDVVIIYDICRIEPLGHLETRMTPAVMSDEHMNSGQELRNRGSNSLDPLVTMLRFLADASIPIEVEEAPERLNRQRARQGRFAIPDHTVVNTRDYITNWRLRETGGSRSAPQGGHHASPIAHWRKAHERMLRSGKTVKVRSSKVNWRDADELHRLFYRAKQVLH